MVEVFGDCRLHMVQPPVCRFERQADLYVSTLRRYIEAIDRDNPDVGDTLQASV